MPGIERDVEGDPDLRRHRGLVGADHAEDVLAMTPEA